MASVSVSQLIIFIAAMLVAASVAGLLTDTVGDIGQAVEEQGFSTSDEIRSDIDIINDPGAEVVNETAEPNEVTLYIKNTGSRELSTEPDRFDILINGIFLPPDNVQSVTVLPEDDGNEIWGQNDVVRLIIEDPDGFIGDGENRIQVGIDGGQDVFIWERQ